jgi:xanthine dehydrogenase/oxidase
MCVRGFFSLIPYAGQQIFCSYFSLLQENPAPSQQQVEDSFDGNLCRCTGYRAILDSMKSFAADKGGTIDIEVCYNKIKIKEK